MAMLEQRIQQHFFDSADLMYQAADGLTRSIADAAHAMLGCITGGGKLLVYGDGMSHVLAERLVDLMLGRFERDRPGLAAVQVHAGAGIRALGSPGDVLVMLSAGDASRMLGEAIAEAHEREMTVVSIVGRAADALVTTMAETDVLVQVPHEREARVHELHLLIVHCLCDAVDLQLMGEEQSA